MVEFCPECGNLLRRKSCKCGYNQVTIKAKSLNQIWDPPSPNIVYCRLTATSYEKLKSMLNKKIYPEKLKEVRKNLRNRFYKCKVCLYYDEKISLCRRKNKFLKMDSICKSFEPFDNPK